MADVYHDPARDSACFVGKGIPMSLEKLSRALSAAGLPSTFGPGCLENVAAYFSLREKWSQTHNVAGPQSMKAPWELDLPDAVAVLQVLEPNLPLTDVGTGSGTPGMLVACMLPDTEVLLVEPIAKRTAFLRMCVAQLQLKNVRVFRERWPCRIPADTAQVISRAVVSPEEWPHLATGRENGADHVIRMLAAHRPAMSLSDYVLQSTMEYSLGLHGERLVERWAPQKEAAPRQ